jgi:multiple sugar transport system substrate-binding protein
MNARAQNTDLAWALIAAGNTKDALVALNADDPHLPPREDAAADKAFREDPFLATMIASFPSLTLFPADPAYRQLVGVIQNATGIVATGDATPKEAVERYASEMTRILGEDRVVAQPCE